MVKQMNRKCMLALMATSTACIGLLAFSQAAVSQITDASSEPVELHGRVLVIRNPNLSRMGSAASPDHNHGPDYITVEQMQESVPKAFPVVGGSSVVNLRQTAGEIEDQDHSSEVRVIEATPPHPDAGIASFKYFAEDLLHEDLDGVPHLADSAISCPAPNGWGSMLDCYYHPWTETPGSIFPEYRTRYPWSTVGKLYFHDYDDPSDQHYHHCTAQVISGPPSNLLVTAAHCVISPGNGKPSKNLFFVPAYSNGTQPFGQFKYQLAMVLPEFVKNGGRDRKYDVALVSLQNDADGRPVSYYTGTLGLILNASYAQNLTLMGYSVWQVPDGAWSTVVNAQSYRYEGTDTSSCKDLEGNELDGTDTLFVGSPLGPGSSGGGWINAFYPFEGPALGRNYLASVVSGAPFCAQQGGIGMGTPDKIVIGPRFSDDNIGILCNNIVGGCGTQNKLLTLTATVTGDGYVASVPTGLSCGSEKGQSKTCEAQFIENSKVTLSAIPERGKYVFIGWGGACEGADRTCVVEMNTHHEVSAFYE